MSITAEIMHSVDSFSDQAIRIRRELHMNPELSFKEFETTKKISEELSALGLVAIPFEKTTGLYTELKSSRPDAKTVLIRADIDALPIQDEKNTTYRSRNKGVMHACGHDAHTSTLISVLKVLAEKKEELPFSIKGVFQPAEELGKGALSLIDQGVLDGVDYAISLHVEPAIPLGSVSVRSGPTDAGITSFTMTFSGTAAHGARPFLGTDAVQMAAQFITTAYAKVPRSIDNRDPMVLHFGTINGGRAMNFIADSCVISGSIRTLKNETMKDAVEELRRVAEATVMMFGGSMDFKIEVQMAPVVNDPFVSDAMFRAACDTIGKNNVVTDLPASMGGEDFGAFMLQVPGAMIRIGVGNIKQSSQALHTPLFDIEEESIAIAAKILALSVFELDKEAIDC
jgi:amidohydrolase